MDRACSHKKGEYLIIRECVNPKATSAILSKFGGSDLPREGIVVPLSEIELKSIPEFVQILTDN
jgi:hypothetical protein